MTDEAPERIVREKRVLVVCGAGGVGKTTTAASIALAAARSGRRVLVITIDPSKRLAQTLGVSPDEPEPRALDATRQRALGITPPGSLSAWMLDPKAVSDRTVRRLSPDPATTDRLLRNRVYRNATSMIAGMQEYMAVEALHEFVRDDRYDLVVLDTPPSRDALRFLEAPSRATAFFDRRVLRFFVPASGGRIRQAAARVFERLLDLAFGERTRREMQQFFGLFEHVLSYLSRSQGEMQRFFGGPGIAFVLVSSPSPESLEEARYFEQKTRSLSLPLAGHILNRSLAWRLGQPIPTEIELPQTAPPSLRSALAKLAPLAVAEARLAGHHEEIRRGLMARSPEQFALALPELVGGAFDLSSLIALAEAFEATSAGRHPPDGTGAEVARNRLDGPGVNPGRDGLEGP